MNIRRIFIGSLQILCKISPQFFRRGQLSKRDQIIFHQIKPNNKFLQGQYGYRAMKSGLQYKGIQLLTAAVMIGILQQNQNQCWFSSFLPKNKLDNRAATLQYAANNPIEDRCKTSQLSGIDGYAVSVFDGHGGWQLAEFATNILHDKIDFYLNQNKLIYGDKDDLIKKSIEQAYEFVEKEFYEVARRAYEMGFPSVARVGSCALTAIISDNKVYSANLGDCKGIIVNTQKKNFQKINHMQNANSKKEQLRLKSQFPDTDIVICKKGKGSCYVKGRLQPTRTLGDFRLKYNEFNNPNSEPIEKGFLKQIDNFGGPYISAIPEQQVFNLSKGDRYLVLGSDGLWDEMTKKEIVDIVTKFQSDKNQILQTIFDQSIQHAAKDNNLSNEQIKEIPLGKRRKIHDDITILVIDLQNQI